MERRSNNSGRDAVDGLLKFAQDERRLGVWQALFQERRKYFAWASPKKPAKQKAEPDTHVKTMRRRQGRTTFACRCAILESSS